ncbi:YwqG family protein [Clostridium felsineum]|uniref:Uncharacterized protein n=1 Tax=Clostridium felsineum TaxID=36839 RepID=A0A1S8KX01_9CLOT|nr:YwqG family protein [Clostridium felsineum]URZ00365.1 hypothetical protein CLAUR_003530 [Clostridium felsineum]URZ07000.1 hypothetical protein CLROS_023330 [Clostridium felsineum]URZ12030.1 hypothetical protein CROST_027470 [Clostridium felsineum]
MKKIDELLEEYELTDIKDYIYKNIKNSIYLSLTGEDDYKVQGVSRVGGYPDVPEKFEWPSTKDGEPMTFIAQLNLKEISLSDENDFLPKGGILYFFMGIDEPAYDIEHKVVFVEADKNLMIRKPDKVTVLEEDYEESFVPYKIESKACVEIPNYAYMDYDIIEDSDEYFSLEESIRFENQGENYIGKIYGYPEDQHNDSELEAALKIIANHKYSYSSKDKEKLIAALNGDEGKADAEINDIVMLLEIDSNSKIGFSWWDCGVIHFFIRKEDLKNRNFDKTYLSLYSS